MLAPTREVLPPGVKLIYTQPGEAFSLYVTVALIAGVVVAAPFIMYQVWMFIAPGLYANEKKMAYPFVALTTLGLPARRRIQSLRRVRRDDEVLRQLQHRGARLHAQAAGCLRALHEDAARARAWCFRCRRSCSSSRR